MSRKIMPRARKSNAMLSSFSTCITNAFEKLNFMKGIFSSLKTRAFLL